MPQSGRNAQLHGFAQVIRHYTFFISIVSIFQPIFQVNFFLELYTRQSFSSSQGHWAMKERHYSLPSSLGIALYVMSVIHV